MTEQEIPRCTYHPGSQSSLDCGHGECRKTGQWDPETQQLVQSEMVTYSQNRIVTREMVQRTHPAVLPSLINRMVRMVQETAAAHGRRVYGEPDIILQVRWKAAAPVVEVEGDDQPATEEVQSEVVPSPGVGQPPILLPDVLPSIFERKPPGVPPQSGV